MSTFLHNIPSQWIQTHGRNTKIGVIDSGFDIKNTYIKNHITKYEQYGYTDKDHGTHVLGIMCLDKDYEGNTIGFSNKSEYYLSSVPIGQKNAMNNICDSLQKMITYQIDVLNMSFANYTDHEKMKKLLKLLYDKGTIIVSSYSDDLLYPHSYPFVIGAGYDLIVKNYFKSSIANDKFKTIKGTSMQSAFISSVASIAKSFNKKINKK